MLLTLHHPPSTGVAARSTWSPNILYFKLKREATQEVHEPKLLWLLLLLCPCCWPLEHFTAALVSGLIGWSSFYGFLTRLHINMSDTPFTVVQMRADIGWNRNVSAPLLEWKLAVNDLGSHSR